MADTIDFSIYFCCYKVVILGILSIYSIFKNYLQVFKNVPKIFLQIFLGVIWACSSLLS
jgi:hypothetical protein